MNVKTECLAAAEQVHQVLSKLHETTMRQSQCIDASNLSDLMRVLSKKAGLIEQLRKHCDAMRRWFDLAGELSDDDRDELRQVKDRNDRLQAELVEMDRRQTSQLEQSRDQLDTRLKSVNEGAIATRRYHQSHQTFSKTSSDSLKSDGHRLDCNV